MSIRHWRWKSIFLNKYLIVGLFFVIWMTFFDQNSYFLHKEINEDMAKLEEEAAYYQTEIDIESQALEKLKKDPAAYEKLAREKYLMKKENEDIFVIEKKDSGSYE